MLSETCTFVLGPRGVTTRTGKAANSLSGFPSELQRRGSLGGPELVLSQNKRRRLHAPLTPTAALMSGTGGHIGSESSLVNTERKGRGGRDQMSGTEDLETTRTGGHRASARGSGEAPGARGWIQPFTEYVQQVINSLEADSSASDQRLDSARPGFKSASGTNWLYDLEEIIL